MASSPRERTRLHSAVALERRALPNLQALYLFGSHARGDARAESDVDLVDLRAASDVLRVQVLAHGELLFDADRGNRELFEAHAFADYARLNEERAEILADIARRGLIYG